MPMTFNVNSISPECREPTHLSRTPWCAAEMTGNGLLEQRRPGCSGQQEFNDNGRNQFNESGAKTDQSSPVKPNVNATKRMPDVQLTSQAAASASLMDAWYLKHGVSVAAEKGTLKVPMTLVSKLVYAGTKSLPGDLPMT